MVSKYNHWATLEAKIDVMHHQIKEFIELFNPLFRRGITFFWEEKEESDLIKNIMTS